MKLKLFLALITGLLFTLSVYAQHALRVVVQSADEHKPLAGATALLTGTTIGAVADTGGLVVLKNIPVGRQVIRFSFIGFKTREQAFVFPIAQSQPFVLLLEQNAADDDEAEAVYITATRSHQTIANVPTRVEIISGEELEEKGNMKPGDIRMLLAESTGIQTQQTSATSANATIRIQGLDGKYTQILRDGFPIYAGFSGGLGLLQIAPLDLQQVEVIKGSSSTLYGGGAIAGLVNLVSKTPSYKRQLNVLLNGTSAGGLDASAFYAQKFGKTGATVYAAYNHGSPYDPSDAGFTAIPRFNRFTLNPKLFLYLDDRTTLTAGINATTENRMGGDIRYIEGHGDAQHTYFEQNKTGRYSSQVELQHRFHENQRLTIRNSVSLFDRTINLPGYRFSGRQTSTYTEANYSYTGAKAEWIAGTNLLTDRFGEDQQSGFPLRNYNYSTVGAFVQNTWKAASNFTLETGLRGDHHNRYGFFLLPRVSGLLKINTHFSTRLGGGLGYKAPSVFTEEAERIQFRNVLPPDANIMQAEQSYGANFDVNYQTGLFDDQLNLSINQLFFYTHINHPMVLTTLAGGILQYQQPSGNLNTRGLETNVRLAYNDLKLYIGYTLANVKQRTGEVTATYPLVARHRLNNVLMYELENKWKIGLEAYYFSKQQLNDGTTGRAYWTAGIMAEKLWTRFSLFINLENLTDTRQTRFDSIYNGSISNPVFRDIYAPLDGFVVNGGIKLKL